MIKNVSTQIYSYFLALNEICIFCNYLIVDPIKINIDNKE